MQLIQKVYTFRKQKPPFMKIYYIYENDEQIGPLSIDELRDKKINANTPVWKEGFSDWRNAGSLDELKSLLNQIPPPFKTTPKIPKPVAPKTSTSEKTGFLIGRYFWIIGLIAVLAFAIFFYIKNKTPETEPILQPDSQSQSSDTKSPVELKKSLLEIERDSPTDYLSAEFTFRKNLISEMVLEGTISNSATLANFKDVKINITWLSKTNSELESKEYTIYELVSAKGSATFKLKELFYPKETKGVSMKILGATSVN